MPRLVALVLLGACGRIYFAPLDDAGGDVSDAFDACAIRSIAVGERHVCALRNDNAIYCAGDNTFGQLGTGILSAPQPTPVLATEWTALGAPSSVHAGRQNTSVRDSSGMLFGVGANGNRQLGTTAGGAAIPTRGAAAVPALSTVAFGNAHGCGITPANEAYCWGDSDEGQGDSARGTSPNGHPPELIASLTAQMPVRVGTGTNHVCAVLSGARLACWGDGELFRLGYVATDSCPNATAGPISCQTTPGIVPLAGVMDVAAGHEHTCAAMTDGSVMCWGSNDRGQAGQAPSSSTGIMAVAGVSDVFEIAAGRHFNCARDAMGRVWCWGAADLDQLGRVISASESPTPLEVVLSRPATSVVSHALGNTVCALLDDGTVSCWGTNDAGQLGRGTLTTFEVPGPFTIPCE